MNAVDVLKYGQLTVIGTLDGLPDADWETAGVCGVWSVKEIVAHLASYEQVLVDICASLVDGRATPNLDAYRQTGAAFNDGQVALRRGLSPEATLRELDETHARAIELAKGISADDARRPGTLPWYGNEYSLDDVIVYMYYGHKREHSAQVAVFRDRIKR